MSNKKILAWLILLLSIIAAFISVFIPAWLIMPFKGQTARGVAISYFFKSWSPWITAVAAILVAFPAIYLWSRSGWFLRTVLVLGFVPVILTFWFARQNHFEWMFNPNPDPDYVRAAGADFVREDDMVLAVALNGEAVAYPIRQMGYHHLVHDDVGGVPIVATY